MNLRQDRWLAAALLAWVLVFAAWPPAAAAPAAPPAEPSPCPGAAGLYTDAAAGVAFLLPSFVGLRCKTAQQVRDLLLRRPGIRIPPAAEFTTGLYSASPDGSPYLLVWRLRSPPELGPEELGRLAAASALDGLSGAQEGFQLSSWRYQPDAARGEGSGVFAGGLQARFAVQLLQTSSVYIGLFYHDAADAELFTPVLAGLKLLEPPLAVDKARPQAVSLPLATALAGLILITVLAYWLLGRRASRTPS